MLLTLARALDRMTENPVFAVLDHSQLTRLFKHSELHQLRRGQTVCEAGAPCTGLHAVLDGQVKVFARTADGHEKVIDVVQRGQNLPGTQLTHAEPHGHHAQALCDTWVLVVPHAVLRAELHVDRQLTARLLDDAASQVRRLMREIEATSLRTAMQRVCDYLLSLPEGRDPCVSAPASPAERVVTLPVSKGTIASLLSITPEHLSRMLRDLQAGGLIDMQGRRIRLLAPMQLSACT